ncbi:MAG: C40 family peptidase [Bacteroidales bacterium]|nr:C40 family peptidase [Bacteroidales bacterium]
MDRLICANIFVPLRLGPSHRSEQGSQLLFGEKYLITDRSAEWLKVRNEFDSYEGWIDGEHHLFFEAGEADGVPGVLASRTKFTSEEGDIFYLEAGSEIYNINKEINTFTIGGKRFRAEDRIITTPLTEDITVTAMRFLNCPYLWGGRTAGGMDCSGLTQLVYKLHGHSLPRDSFRQAETGTAVSFLEEARAGDLLFFDNKQGNITHVGMLLDRKRIIHCSGKVRIDMIDHQGIYIENTNKYTHSLRIIKRI